jgi:CDP-diacylglycerol--glycerol-3-phosphate 3-phosphatidyltransferase
VLADRPSLQLHLQLDYFRSTRPGPENTAVTLLPLLKAYPDRVKVSFYRSPTLRGLLARIIPRRWDEGWGTWHAKIYGIDDELLLTGYVDTIVPFTGHHNACSANLNTSYFTNRQDRYIHLRGQCSLANYCSDFLQIASRASHTLQPPTHPSEEYQLCPPTTSLEDSFELYEELSSNLSSLQASYRSKGAATKSEVELLPIVQSGPLFIAEEETALATLFESLYNDPNAVFDLTSGYFGLYEDYQQYVLKSKAKWRILAANPKV